MGSTSPSYKGKEPAVLLELLDLPGEILSQIASYLPLGELIPFLSLHSALHNLTRSHLTPLRAVIKDVLRGGPPFPNSLAVLPSLHHLVHHDYGGLFVEILVRAPPKWILEQFEIGRWREAIWQEAFERRFLPSWKRYKSPEDSWRAAFLRVLGRLEHRSVGCSHHESWTRFITLRRNGSATINRIYTRPFDPHDIFDELKHQANLADYPTQVRVLVHLQDVRVITLGVLSERPSFFTNPNAHLALHPPLLRHLTISHDHRGTKPRRLSKPAPAPVEPPPHIASIVSAPTAAVEPHPEPIPDNSLTRTLSSTSSTRWGSTRSASPIASLFGSWLNRRESIGEGSSASHRSEDGGRRRSWSFSRTRSNSTSAPAPAIPIPVPPETPTVAPTLAPPIVSTPTSPFSPITPPIPLMPTLPEDNVLTPRLPSPITTSPRRTRYRVPYAPITRPTPAYTHALYPNFTPFEDVTLLPELVDPAENYEPPGAQGPVLCVRDFRADYLEMEDNSEPTIWTSNEEYWAADGMRLTEWDAESGTRRRWVGPMIILAQLFPTTRRQGVPAGAPRDSAVEGPHPELGPRGTYASLGWEDIDALLPWVDIRGSGGLDNMPRRNGLGFEPGQEL